MNFVKKIIGGFLEFFYRVTQNYGISIVLLTVFVKAITIPLVISQKKQMEQNSMLAPKIKEIKEKYKNDKEKMTLEITELYKSQKINPLNGCVVALLQPLLIISLYCVIKRPITYFMGVDGEGARKIISASNHWAIAQNEIGISDPSVEMMKAINNVNFPTREIEVAKQMFLHPEILDNPVIDEALMKNITLVNFNFLGLDLSITPKFESIAKLLSFNFSGHLQEILLLTIPLLAALTTYISTMQIFSEQKQRIGKHDAKISKDTGQAEIMQMPSNSIIWISPLMSALVTFSSPAGLGIYWVVSNLFQIAQQSVIKIFSEKKKCIRVKCES